ncbi:methyl-accepting chemotaxis protein [Kurthia huakuii]|uniref:methyl-accepting chemotaxis protein n=1 Tax=Kurthia huakuii TaxID=1421019 RepID=UPI0004953FF5|nr:methyl-accepting chemotaxis protein [Kurthia huakuii]MBM7699208.1 methyl-accepting chemotaxis protein [Kurthia huakuii]
MKSIKTKILVVLLSITVAFGALISYSIYTLQSTSHSYAELIDHQGEVRNNIQVVVSESVKQSLAVRGLIVSTALKNEEEFNKAKDEIDNRLQRSQQLVTSQKDKDVLASLLELNNDFAAQFNDMNTLVKNGGTQKEAIDYWQTKVFPVGQEMMKTAQDYATQVAQDMAKENDANNQHADQVFILMLVLMILVVIAAVITSLVFARVLATPITRVTDATKRVANGDLTVETLDVRTKDEIGELTTSFNQMVENLQNLVETVSESSEHVASSSEQLMASSDQTSKATEQITSSMQEVASGSRMQEDYIDDNKRALEEMSAGVTRVAEATHSVAELSDNATQIAQDGQHSIDQVITQMNQISTSTNDTAQRINSLNERSTAIADIVSVITDISDQTNLLALNAAIEAARAGEHGKGFAVVADEVRHLAEQSKQSADDIATLISEIQTDTKQAVVAMTRSSEDVSAGMNAVSEAGTGFTKINEAIVDISGQIMDITAVAQQMSASSTHIVSAMQQIATLSQDASGNSESVAAASEEQLASMQEVTAAAEALSERAEALLQEIRFFKVQ